MADKNYKVSIIMPVYNGANYMEQALTSALNQTYENIEIILVNDGSTDNGLTEKIALSYKNRITYIYQKNQGTGGALNTGIKNMTGDYFSWLSHDDFYASNKIEAQIRLVHQINNPKAVIYSNFNVIDAKGGLLNQIKLPNTPPEKMLLFLFVYQAMHGCSLLIPKAVFSQVGLFDASLRTTQDYDLWLKACQVFPFYLCNEFLMSSRIHAQQSTHILPDHSHEREKFYLDHMYSLTFDYLKTNLPVSDWLKYFMDVAGAMVKRNCFTSFIHWLVWGAELSARENRKLQEALVGAMLLPLAQTDNKALLAHLMRYFKVG